MSEAKTIHKTGKPRKKLADFTPEERRIIEWLEEGRERELNEQEAHLALEQARHLGEL